MRSLSDPAFIKGIPVPERLYHYTTQRGLLGILSSRKMFATGIRYLNDSTEFIYTENLWKQALDARLVNPQNFERSAYQGKIWDELLKLRESFTSSFSSSQLYVCCFSEDGDSLSQWRGYARSGGYNLGFNTHKLWEAARLQMCIIAPCVYDENEQQDLIEKHLVRVLATLGYRDDDGVVTPIEDFKGGNIGTGIAVDYMSLATLIKHPSFRDEREWRVVTPEVRGVHPQVNFREGRTILIPHFEFDLALPEEKLDVDIVVGPNSEMSLAIESIRLLTETMHCVGSLKPSSVPYREI